MVWKYRKVYYLWGMDIEKYNVYLWLVDVAEKSVLLPNFPFIPRSGDVIDVPSIIDKKNYSDNEYEEICNLCWSVLYVKWGKDVEGFYVELVCEGE